MVPVPEALRRAQQTLGEVVESFRHEGALLDVEHQRLDNWQARLEGKTKEETSIFTEQRGTLEKDKATYRGQLLRVFEREVAVNTRERRAQAREETITLEEARLVELQTQLDAHQHWLEEAAIRQQETTTEQAVTSTHQAAIEAELNEAR